MVIGNDATKGLMSDHQQSFEEQLDCLLNEWLSTECGNLDEMLVYENERQIGVNASLFEVLKTVAQMYLL